MSTLQDSPANAMVWFLPPTVKAMLVTDLLVCGWDLMSPVPVNWDHGTADSMFSEPSEITMGVSPAAQPNTVRANAAARSAATVPARRSICCRSEEHTSELQSPCNLVCR